MQTEPISEKVFYSLQGISPWAVVALIIVVALSLRALTARELAPLRPGTRRGLWLLRALAAAVMILLLLEPVRTRVVTEAERPTVAVLMDTSGSMSVTDRTMHPHHRLNEAVALGLVPADARDTTAMEAARLMQDVLPDVAPTAGLLRSAPAENLEEPREEAAEHARQHAAALLEFVPRLQAHPEVVAELDHIGRLWRHCALRLEGEDEEETTDGSIKLDLPETLAERLEESSETCRALRRACRDIQRNADAALVARDAPESPVKQGLQKLSGMSRFERAWLLARKRLAPHLDRLGEVRYYELKRGLAPLDRKEDHAGRVTGLTDVATPLSELARRAEGHLGAVLLLSDGRQTSGEAPGSAARALRARGTQLAAVMVGNPETPRDATVGEILGSTEVFKGEKIRLDVRFRITGYADAAWDLVVTRDGKEEARRRVSGTGQWQQERFTLDAETAGIHQIQARLEVPRDTGADADSEAAPTGDTPPHGLLREYWTGVSGDTIADLQRHKGFPKEPSGSDTAAQAAGPKEWAEAYGTRMRGWIVAPLSGDYTFWITADDQAELWLSTDADPQHKTLIASCPSWAGADEWQRHDDQQSAPITLREGRHYYVEILHKEGRGGDHVAVGWQRPDSRIEKPIPGDVLVPFHPGRLEHLLNPPEPEPVAEDAQQPDRPPEASLDNNQTGIIVAVNEDPLRVLLVDHRPRWESRYLVSMFERDKRVQLDRRYRLVRLGRPLAEGEPFLLPKTQEELDVYDLVVLGDLRPNELGPDDQKHLAEFVSRRGGFLMVLSGPRAMPAAYNLGGIARILPIRNLQRSEQRPPDAGGTNQGAPEAATVDLAERGHHSPITAVLDDPELNRQLWPALPPLQWVRRQVEAVQGAQVLLKTDDGSETPLVVTARYGAGRVMYLGTDETWRWRDRLGDRVHQTFWLQVLRWGLGARLRGKDPRLQVALDRTLMAPEDLAELRARARLPDGEPVDAELRLLVERLGPDGEPELEGRQEIVLTPIAGAHGIRGRSLGGDVHPLRQGMYRLTVTCAHDAFEGLEEVRQLVVQKRQGREGLDLTSDPEALQELVRAKWSAHQGRLPAGGMEEAETIVKSLDARLEPRLHKRRETLSLWDNYWAIMLVVGLLMAEWIWRKRVGLP